MVMRASLAGSVPRGGSWGATGCVPIAEADLGQLERAPIEVGAELVGDDHLLRRRGGLRIVLEVDAVGQDAVTADETDRPKTSRARLPIRVQAPHRGGGATSAGTPG